MGTYTYTVRAKKKVIEIGGRKVVAHLAGYAGKPSYYGSNVHIDREVGRAHSYWEDRETPEFLVTGFNEGSAVFLNPNGIVSFYDDCTFGTERMPQIGVLMQSGKRLYVVDTHAYSLKQDSQRQASGDLFCPSHSFIDEYTERREEVEKKLREGIPFPVDNRVNV